MRKTGIFIIICFLLFTSFIIFFMKRVHLNASDAQQQHELIDVIVTTYFDDYNQIETSTNVAYGSKLQFDNKVNLENRENYEFVFWILNGVVQYNKEFDSEFFITYNMNLVAIFKPTNPVQHTVIFMDTNGKKIDVQYVNTGEDASDVDTENYSKPGYIIANPKWDKSLENITSDTIVILQYEKINNEEYTLTVNNGNGSNSYAYNYNTTAIIEADEAPSQQVFSHWEKNGIIVSQNPVYKMTMLRDTTITAVYTSNSPDVSPILYLNDVLLLRDDSYSFVGQFNIPSDSGFELVEFGMLTTADYSENLDILTTDVNRKQGFKYFGETCEFLMSFSKDSILSVRAYMVLKQGNNLFTFYSNQQNIEQLPQGEDVNAPILFSGMNPVYWDDQNNEIVKYLNMTTLEVNPNWNENLWYSYFDTTESINTSKWANVKSKDGSYWVWIPRFIYTIKSGWHTSTTGTIDIKFIIGTDDTSAELPLSTTTKSNDSNYLGNGNKWSSHPAFTFGGEQIKGFWFAKFEASKSGDHVKIVPNVQSWTNMTVNDIFNNTRAMETYSWLYGWLQTEVDTHLMKNNEWGAVAYLAHSKYGRNGVAISRNNVNFYTGGSQYYGQWIYNPLQSTTGNLYGVFDMNGAAGEFVAAYSTEGSSPSLYGSSLVNANAKYRDVYSSFANSINFKGDALYETSAGGTNSAWFSNLSGWPLSGFNCWFVRGYLGNDSRSGIFAYGAMNGNANSSYGFRPVLVPKNN